MVKWIYFIILLTVLSAVAHESVSNSKAKVVYLGNEATLFKNGNKAVLFDAFFDKTYGEFTLVPKHITKLITHRVSPFENIDVIFVSHLHGDHFSPHLVSRYLVNNPKTILVAPEQAVERLKIHGLVEPIKEQIKQITLKPGDVESFSLSGMNMEAIRLPHVGTKYRNKVENIVYRVVINDKVVSHFGDSDPTIIYNTEHQPFWQLKKTDLLLLPEIFIKENRTEIELKQKLNGENVTFMHVSDKAIDRLELLKVDYFNRPGQIRELSNKTKKRVLAYPQLN